MYFERNAQECVENFIPEQSSVEDVSVCVCVCLYGTSNGSRTFEIQHHINY